MAMNANQMALAITSAIQEVWDEAPPTHELSDDYNTLRFWTAVCTALIAHIQTNARCDGVDSNNDTHENVKIT